MKRTASRTGILAALVGLAVTALTAVASPAHAGPVQHQAATDAQAVAAYWTPERMRSAVPIERLVQAPAFTPKDVAKGKSTIIQSIPNGGGAWTGAGKVVQTAGRVFFTMGGRNASCSGDAVTSANGSVVITAGHCVKYQGAWHTNWTFAPGYNNGNTPYGTWAAKTTLTTPQWEASEDMNYDIGAAVVNPLNGQKLTDVVGAQGIAFNQARNQSMYTFGYPAAAPYDGSKLIYCSGSTFTDFLLTKDHGMSCDMTGGSSGGPWFLNFSEATGAGVQASVNSFGYTFLPGYMFGPYFGTDAQNLYNKAQAA
ncbi:peptidase [Amycolatopsis sp. WAC 04182]|uniref:trypsin-like serine peptidase n=1 Tax=Amycolatopsis sp. WAC 04182 TaxID=2203198 RepID=UPI000F76DEF7|nr:peptidase [Amycolatopsis sp. WAC 04182]RSN52959.1 peptidase [Amycolatopsis sp. WAC 04182]